MKDKKGSALLLILCVMTMILFTISTIWQASVYVFELGLARQEYEQHYWNALGLANWAIVLCKENFDYFLDYTQANKLEISIKKWPTIKNKSLDKKNCTASIIISKKDSDQVLLEIILKKSSNNMIFNCCLKRSKDKQNKEFFVIENWLVK